jgi:hypothetical protein
VTKKGAWLRRRNTEMRKLLEVEEETFIKERTFSRKKLVIKWKMEYG